MLRFSKPYFLADSKSSGGDLVEVKNESAIYSSVYSLRLAIVFGFNNNN